MYDICYTIKWVTDAPVQVVKRRDIVGKNRSRPQSTLGCDAA